MFRDIRNTHLILLKQLQEKCNRNFFSNQSSKDKQISELVEDKSSKELFAKHFQQALTLFSEELKLLKTVYSNLLADSKGYLDHCFNIMEEVIDSALKKQLELYLISEKFYMQCLVISEEPSIEEDIDWEFKVPESIGSDYGDMPGIPGPGHGYGGPATNSGPTSAGHHGGGQGSKKPWKNIFSNLVSHAIYICIINELN